MRLWAVQGRRRNDGRSKRWRVVWTPTSLKCARDRRFDLTMANPKMEYRIWEYVPVERTSA